MSCVKLRQTYFIQSQVCNIDQTKGVESQRNKSIPLRSDVSKGGLSTTCLQEWSKDLLSLTPKVEGWAAPLGGEKNLFLFLDGAFEVDEETTKGTTRGALTDGFNPRETISASQIFFPLFFLRRALARALLSSFGTISTKIGRAHVWTPVT